MYWHTSIASRRSQALKLKGYLLVQEKKTEISTNHLYTILCNPIYVKYPDSQVTLGIWSIQLLQSIKVVHNFKNWEL